MKVLALDLGDSWTGSALSDPLKMFAKPYETVSTQSLESWLVTLCNNENIDTIVVGLPKTLQGKNSKQTDKIIQQTEKLKSLLPEKKWVMWDERLTSKQASHVAPAKNKQQKLQQHSVAAAILLESYLLSLSY